MPKPKQADPDKPKLGRPRRTGAASDERVTFRLTTAELELLKSAAGELTLGDWIRDVVLAAARDQGR